MKKSLWMAVAALLVAGCQKEEMQSANNPAQLVVTGYCSPQSRTAFGEPDSSTIPFGWTKGDRIWLGEQQSAPIEEDGSVARFEFQSGTAVVGTGHIFYNMTGQAAQAKVLAEQTADGNLGNDGDFGYATLDSYNSFCLSHKSAYVWFDTTTPDSDMPLLRSITLTSEAGLALAGECRFDVTKGEWESSVSAAASTVTLHFEDGYALQPTNQGVMAAMVLLPARVAETKLTICYTFDDGSSYSETKQPTRDFVSGATQRIATAIAKSDLKREPELDYELRVLTFEDADARFSPYWLDYADGWMGREISTWSDLIDNPQYSGPLLYGNDATDACYYWYDEGNTELYHLFPDNYAYCFWGGGHAVSNYWASGYADEDRNGHIVKFYGQDYLDQWTGRPGADSGLGWFLLQLMTPIKPHSGNNFAVHYGYKDAGTFIENLPELSFYDGEPRIIDHMYVTNTNYTLNQLHNGVKSEEGNTFGGNWTGLTEDAWLKLVAYGYASIDDDEPTTETEFYLVQGYKVVEDWQKWDLTELGKVAKVRFNFLYSDEMGGRYGFTIPGYFAYDDIAVRFDK